MAGEAATEPDARGLKPLERPEKPLGRPKNGSEAQKQAQTNFHLETHEGVEEITKDMRHHSPFPNVFHGVSGLQA